MVKPELELAAVVLEETLVRVLESDEELVEVSEDDVSVDVLEILELVVDVIGGGLHVPAVASKTP